MNEWMNHPAMQNLDPAKLELIKIAAIQTAGKSNNELPPVMMALIHAANKKGISFTEEEFDLIMEIMKDGKSEEEQKQIDHTIQMVRSVLKKRKD